MEGLTIAFICVGDNHPTTLNYEKFGNQYWDDCRSNKSKKGYYFAYYIQKKTVRIHQITHLLSPSEKPIEMEEWTTDRQILGLSPVLKEYTWNDWITDVGLGAPYASDYRSTQTGSWSVQELQDTFPTFDFARFKYLVTSEENLSDDEFSEDEVEENVDLLNLVNKRVVRNLLENMETLRVNYAAIEEKKIDELYATIEHIKQQIETLHVERSSILEGSRDAHIVSRETEIKMNRFIADFM